MNKVGHAPSREPVSALWREYHGRTVLIAALTGSYAARQAPAILEEAEGSAEELSKLLARGRNAVANPIRIYLIDPPFSLSPLPTEPGEQASNRAIVRVVQPEAPGEPITTDIVRELVREWYGPGAVTASSFLEGLAGVLAARQRGSNGLREVHLRVRSMLEQGVLDRPITIPPVDEAARSAALTSFVAFLLDAHDVDAVSRLLKTYDPDRSDQAFLGAYHRPLGELEQTWLTVLQRGEDVAGIGAFFGYLVPLLRPYWKREVEVLVLMLLGLTYSLAIPLAGKFLVDSVIPRHQYSRLLIFILALAVFYVISGVIGVRRVYVNYWINQHVLTAMQGRIFIHLQQLSHDFYLRAKVGDVMTRMSNDLETVDQALSQVAGVGIYLALAAIAAIVTMLCLNLLLGFVVLLILPLFTLSYLLLGRRLGRASRRRQGLRGEVNTLTQESLSAYSLVKALGLEKRMTELFQARLMQLLKSTMRLVVLGSLFEISTALAVTFGQIVVLGLGGYLVMRGNLTIGTLLAFIGLLPAIFQPISTIFQILEGLQMSSGSMERVMELLDEPVTIQDAPDAAPLQPLEHEIRFDHVTFTYGGNRPILSDLSLRIATGGRVAIVGPSGSGKSTIVNLLLRFWDPEQGRVLFDGQDVRKVTLASLRNQIGLVFQDTFIFDTTFRENIAIARPGASDTEVEAAVQAARLDDYVTAMPNGYETLLGEHGVTMSGGQRQRLAIARAMLRNPRIIILDEATSALDAQTEREILDTLAALAENRTTITITHRLTSVMDTDWICVLDHGQVVEQGTHEQLMKSGGLYQELYEEQTRYGGATRGRRVEAHRLTTIPLFQRLDVGSVAAVADHLAIERYAAGETVVRQGEPGDRLYILNRGEVEILVEDAQGERRINTLREGDYFGEIALLAGGLRVATVRTLTPSEFFSLDREDFLGLLEREPGLQGTVTETVARRRAALETMTAEVA